jgi:hypothetical protein
MVAPNCTHETSYRTRNPDPQSQSNRAKEAEYLAQVSSSHWRMASSTSMDGHH